MAIYHESKDGNWYFVQSYNYNGWVEKKYIAECSQDELRAFLKPEEKIVVISDYVMLENVPVRMGQALPLVSETETTYNVKFPIRNDGGSLTLKEITINKDENYNKGYLKYEVDADRFGIVERLELYDEYQKKRNIVKEALTRMKLENIENPKTK